MKLKSKISILIIFLAVAIYFSIDLLNNENNLSIKTIKGDQDELGYINIYFGYDFNGYINSRYIINGSNKTKKTELLKSIKESENTNNLIDVSSGLDSIAHVGFEISDDSKSSSKGINFVIDEKKEDLEKGVFISEGSDKKVEYEKLDMDNFIRTKYKVDKDIDEYHVKVLSSKRYKKDLYVSVLYAPNESSEKNEEDLNTIDIIKINTKSKKIETIKSINISKYLFEKYNNIQSIDVSYSSKDGDKMYILIEAINANTWDDVDSKLNLLEYNVKENKDKIIELKSYNRMSLEKAKLKDSKLYMIMSERDNSNKSKEVNLITYNILDGSLVEDKYVLDEKEERSIRNIEIDSNKIIVCTSKTNSVLPWDNKTILYIINKNSKEIVYKGELQFNSSNSSLEFEIK
ncbi:MULTISPECIES: hypothetical protein [unclassified Clostridioides]|uniref:hypothetical protein n=1 Tax=unclassified Clostridioides TaxID=2635829 RepID=UPI001D0C23D2|nr:hypothetical protein [Clostridioides sp. ES-S-0048-02]MCC0762016.1 hypothetical protein [Clostridioides sp. ES-S-0006-03]